MINNGHFIIEYTQPPNDEQRYARNVKMDIICASVDRALELFRERDEVSVVHVIRRVGAGKELIIDDQRD